MQIHWTTVIDIIQEAPYTWTYKLDSPADFTWEEGAHTHLALEGFNSGEKPNKSLVRHMSISTLPGERAIGITTRIKDECSEFKSELRKLTVGDSVALFKTHSNVTLKREDKAINLLSCGVGIATFRPLVLEYLSNASGIDRIHSLSIDSSKNYLFSDIFKPVPEHQLSVQYVNNRHTYYKEVEQLATDKHALFYVVGGDEFLKENISFLRRQGITDEQITLDKHESRAGVFFV